MSNRSYVNVVPFGGEHGASVFINGASVDLPSLHKGSTNEYLGARA